MKILLLHQYFQEKDGKGGARFNEMTGFWARAGHKVTVLAGMFHDADGQVAPRHQGNYTYRDDFAPGVTVIRSAVSANYDRGFLGRLWGYFSFVISSFYAGLFKLEEKPDVILVTSPPLFLGITAYLLSRLKGVPFVFEVRDLWPESAIDTGMVSNGLLIKMAYWLEGFLYGKADHVTVLTPAFRRVLMEQKGVPAAKVTFIPNAADFSKTDPLLQTFDRDAFRRENGLEGKTVISYMGAHGLANHLEQVLDAAELLKGEPEILFQLIGDGPRKPWLKEEAARRGLTNVRFVDSQPKPQIYEYIIASDFGTSVLKKVDTFKTIYSNKTFDYMACRRPILMVIDGVSRELVEQAGCGWYVPPEDPAALSAAARKAAALPVERRKELGESGYIYAQKHFDRAKLAEQYLRILTSR